jgi:hypothetical protein
MHRLSALLMLLALAACQNEPGKATRSGGQNSDFERDTTVRVLAPINGETVDSTFVLQYRAGGAVADLQLQVDEEPYAMTYTPNTRGEGEVTIEVGEGRHTIRLAGVDADGVELSHFDLTVRNVVAETPWVTVSSPADGASVSNPVAFTASAADDVDEVVWYADGAELGRSTPSRVFRYEFDESGAEYDIEAVALTDGEVVARDNLTITVTEGSDAPITSANDLVLATLAAYPLDGSYAYWWPDDVDWGGNPHDIYYLGRMFSPGDPERRSYCVGMTFEVFMSVEEQLDELYAGDGSINGVPFDELYDLRTDWFVRDLYGRGIVDAMENYGIGDAITDFDDVQPGDIIQFWRHSGSGHNAIFIDWLYDEGEIVGFEYWSTQGSTDGIGYNDERFGSTGSTVDPSFFFAGRLRMPEDWSPWR